MKKIILLLIIFYLNNLNAQIIVKPRGCFAGTNGTEALTMSNQECRGVLLSVHWSDIETSPGVFNFTNLDNKIYTVVSAGLKYSLAVAAGAFGSPEWLINYNDVEYLEFQYQNKNWKLPLWWSSPVQERMTLLIQELGKKYAQDPNLSHVYITQMTSNGIEGHLNGVNADSLIKHGFTNDKWASAAKNCALQFAEAFPNTALVFEIHEINKDTTVPAKIINDLFNDSNLCKRVGLGMWWISGKDSYQTNLIKFIEKFEGDK